VLLLCEKHNFPSTHATAIYDDSEQQLDTLTSLMGMTAQQARRRAFRDGCELRVMDDGHRWYEPIEGWRHFSREARALLRVATAVYDKKPAPLDEWKTLMIGTTDFDADHVPSHENARWGVAHCVNAWLDLGRVGPIFEWWSSGPDVKFGRRSLFSALALQLMATIGRHGLATCDACGRPYFVRRRPPKGRRGFCEDKACKREAWRLAKRDQYDRKTRRAPVTPRRGAKR
jgi:hypothetical protein